MTKISIIVPVYNVDRFLCVCLNSIRNQTFTDWECLLIDDGSLDKSGHICDEYALKDDRFKVFHKSNGGASSARNLGIDKARGEWITFVDADDFISSTFIEGLYNPIAHGEQVDFVHGGCTNWENGTCAGINQRYEYYIGDKQEILFCNLRGLVVSKLFRLDVIKTWLNDLPLYFDEKIKIAEDMAFTLDYILNVKKYAFVPEIGYFYRRDNECSATKTKKILPYDIELHSFKHLYLSTIEFIKKNELKLESCKKRYSQRGNQLQSVILSLYRNNCPKKQRVQSIKADFSSHELQMLNYAVGNRIKYYVFLLLKVNVSLFDAVVFVLYRAKLIK